MINKMNLDNEKIKDKSFAYYIKKYFNKYKKKWLNNFIIKENNNY